MTDINGALTRLRTAQQNGDFAGIGQAQADLAAAVQRYQAAVGGAGAATPAGAGG